MNTPLTPALAAERDAVEAVARSARAQIDAIRTGSPDAFQDAAAATFDCVAALDRAQAHRIAEGDAVSDDARAVLHAAAADARAAFDDLPFALDHAVAIGRDLIGAWQPLSAPPTSHVYTASGHVGAPAAAGRVRQTG